MMVTDYTALGIATLLLLRCLILSPLREVYQFSLLDFGLDTNQMHGDQQQKNS